LLLIFETCESRPKHFESEKIVTDADGFYTSKSTATRRGEPLAEDVLEHKIRFHPNVIILDRERHIDSIKCLSHGGLILQVQEDAKIEMWDANTILFGGKEWGCVNELGKPSRFAVRPSLTFRRGGAVYVEASIAEQDEVFETLSFKWQSPERMSLDVDTAHTKRLSNKEWNETLSWNYDNKKKQSNGVVHLENADCKTDWVKNVPDLKALCATAKGSDVKIEINCADCWSYYRLNMSFLYDQAAGTKQLITAGTIKTNLTIDVKTTTVFTHNVPDVFKAATSVITFGIPGVCDIDIDFTVAVDIEFKWNILGHSSTGSFMQGTYQMQVGSLGQHEIVDLSPTPNKLGINTIGDAVTKTTLRSGPHFKVHLLLKTFFDAFTELAPFISFGVNYAAGGLPPTKTPNEHTIVKEPWMVTDCPKKHFSEWFLDVVFR